MNRLARALLALTALAAVAAERAGADAELELGVETWVEYDSNVLFRSEQVADDAALRVGPRLRAIDQRGHFMWELRYRPDYEKFLDLSELDGWNHDAYGSVTWQMTQRTQLYVYDQFVDTNRAVSALGFTDPQTPAGEAAAGFGLRGFRQNDAFAELSHYLTPIDRLAINVQSVISENDPFETISQTEGDVTSAGLSWLRTINARTQAGLVARYTNQDFTEVTVGRDSRTRFYNLSVQFVHQLDPTWTLSIVAGPTWLSRDGSDLQVTAVDQPLYPQTRGRPDGILGLPLIETCPTLDDGTPILSEECEVIPPTDVLPGFLNPGFPDAVALEDLAQRTELGLIGDVPSGATDGLTYFANASISKQWRTVTASLRYSRDASTTASANGTVRDVVTARLDWTPGDRWRVTFLTAWEQREEAVTGLDFDQALVPASALVLDFGGPSLVGTKLIGQAAGLRAFEIGETTTREIWQVQLNVHYRLTRRTTLLGRVSWYQNETQDEQFGSRIADRITVSIGVRYTFDPIQLPI